MCSCNIVMLHFHLSCSSLPELLEKKRLIDMHTTIATALLDHIKVGGNTNIRLMMLLTLLVTVLSV